MPPKSHTTPSKCARCHTCVYFFVRLLVAGAWEGGLASSKPLVQCTSQVCICADTGGGPAPGAPAASPPPAASGMFGAITSSILAMAPPMAWEHALDWLMLGLVGALVISIMILLALVVQKYCMPGSTVVELVKNVAFPYGVAEDVGQRPYMEDRHLVSGDISGQPHFSLYAVFDGHGGSRAAHFCARNMSLVLNRKMLEGASPEGVRNPSKALAETFAELDRWWLSLAENAVPPMDDGTTAVAALVVSGPAAAQCGEPAPGDSLPLVFVANTGDSRAVVVLDNGQAVALSDDHKPNRPDELARIRKAGGQVSFYGVWRVQGILAVSRAIGDRALKQYIVPSPEISRYAVPRKAKYLVLATDGLWDVMSNTELVAVLSSVPAGDTTAAANVLLREALSRGSQDNVTVLVVDLTKQQYPPPPESASPPPRHTPPVVEEEVFHAPDAVDGSSSMRQRVKARAEAASAAAHVPDAAAGTASPAVPSASGQPAARARKWAKHKDSAGLGSGGAVGSAALRALAERSPAPSPGASRASSPDPVPADGGDKAD